MTPLLLVVAGGVAVLAGVAVLRSLGPAVRVGRILATAPRVSVGEALRIAAAGERRFVAVEGRIDSDEEFEDAAHRPLVFRRTRLAARVPARLGARWRTFEDSVEVVRFGVAEGLDTIAVDGSALGEGLVVIPRLSTGVAADLGDRLPPEVPLDAPARATIEQLSSVEHALVAGVPATAQDGVPRMTAGAGRPLVLSTLERPEAMRVLAGGERLRPRLATALLAAGVALLAAGIAWWALDAALGAGVAIASAASPAVGDPSVAPSTPGGDTRSPGEGPGLVGQPLLAIGGVVAVAVLAVLGTLAYVRLTDPGRAPREAPPGRR